MTSYDLNKNKLDFRGNKINRWSINEKRGNKHYKLHIWWIIIRQGFIGYSKKQDLINNNSKDECYVGYHRKDGRLVVMIIKGGFREGLMDYEDILHPKKKLGRGIYYILSLKTSELYSLIKKNGD